MFLSYSILFADVEEGAEIHVGAVEPPAEGERGRVRKRVSERGRKKVCYLLPYY